MQMDKARNFFTEGKMYYDSVNRRVREFEFEEIGSTKAVYDKLRLHDLNIEYILDLKTRKCNVSTPHRGFRPFGVPPEGHYIGGGTLGAIGVPGEEVTISLFEGVFHGRDPFGVTVTQPDCFMVEMSVYYNDTKDFEVRQFYDVVSGVTDANAFVPPRECV